MQVPVLAAKQLFKLPEKRCSQWQRTAKRTRLVCREPAVSSPGHYPTPAPNADLIRKPLLAGRHLIILNHCGINCVSAGTRVKARKHTNLTLPFLIAREFFSFTNPAGSQPTHVHTGRQFRPCRGCRAQPPRPSCSLMSH